MPYLQGDLAAQPGVGGLPDLAHAALADLGGDLAPEGSAARDTDQLGYRGSNRTTRRGGKPVRMRKVALWGCAASTRSCSSPLTEIAR